MSQADPLPQLQAEPQAKSPLSGRQLFVSVLGKGLLLAVPFSLLITVAVIYGWGSSLNLISLMGLMLAVGMVVDAAIQQLVEGGRTDRRLAVRVVRHWSRFRWHCWR